MVPVPGQMAEQVRQLAQEADEVHLLTNNDFGDYAIRNARQWAELLDLS
ncbi:MAG: hypothetical protein IMX01_06830 [Limnochordaceae bacterium]|nr:hypothetical protein [Limnochordaceae bacterium]